MQWTKILKDQKGVGTAELLVYTLGIAVIAGGVYAKLSPIIAKIFTVGANSIKNVTNSGL